MAKFAKRHYAMIAEAIKRAKSDASRYPHIRDPISRVAYELGAEFKMDNITFQWGTFLAACDIKE